MENDLKIFLSASFILHAGLFIAFGLQPKRTAYIVMPIDLLLNAPMPRESAVKGAPARIQPKEIIKKKEKEIVVPKKPKAKPLPEPKKAEPKPEQSGESKTKSEEQEKPQAQPQPAGYSGQITVDTARFPYSYYTNTIVRKIGRYWQWSNEFGKLKSVVFFKISKDGNISDVKLKDTSGDRLFDEQALRAVKMSGPFPPLPDGYAESDLGVYFEFSFRE